MSSPATRRILHRHLFSQLSRAIGRESAQTEFRWMKQTLDNPPPGIPPSSSTLDEMVARRVSGEPLQYILGSQPFGPLNLAVRAPTLIPRPETEDWAIRLAELLAPSRTLRQPLSILDLCTGSGCIPLLLCHLWPAGTAHATGVDISDDAVQLALDNATLCGIAVSAPPQNTFPAGTSEGNFAATIPDVNAGKNTFAPVLADLMRADFVSAARLRPPYDLITSNPPYIPKTEYDHLPASVRNFEDVRALLGDPADASIPAASGESDCTQGLSFYHRIAALVHEHGLLRRDGGVLALEVGDGQAAAVAEIVQRKARFDENKINIWKDPWGKDRVVLART